MNLSPRQLRILVSLSETLSFSRTADRFHMTQPALSRIVRSMEEALGTRLFHRTTRSVRMTDDASALVRIAQRMLDDYDTGLDAMGGVIERRGRRLSVAALPSLAAMLMPQVALSVRATVPDARIEVRDALSDATLDLLRGRAVDFALTSADPSQSEIRYEEFLRDRYVLLSRRDDLRLDAGQPRDLASAIDLGLISMPRGTAARLYADSAYLQLDMQFRPVMEFEHLATIGKFVEAGFGVALLPCLAAMMIQDRDLVIHDLIGAPERSLGIVSLRGDEPGHLAGLAVKAIRACVQELIALEPERLKG
jgi:LysR family transcriptional regulator, carnitine catabolism transcriptional activator